MRTAHLPIANPTVLAAVAAGVRNRRDIAAVTQLPGPVLAAEIARETRAGRLTRTLFGSYHLTTAGSEHVLALLAPITAATFDPATATVPELWHHQVAPRVLPGSTLEDHHQQGYAEEYLLRLDPARHTVDDVVRCLPRVAAALGRPAEQVIPEQHPGRIDSLALLQLVGDDSPLYHRVEHPGPAAFDAATGKVTLGSYADGEPTTWALWDEHGARHGTVSGWAGSGTTTILRGLLAAVADSDLVTAHVVDIAGVSGLAAAGQPTAVTQREAEELLHTVAGELERRIEAASGMWTPTPQRPLVLVVLSNLHTLLAQRNPADKLRLAYQINRLQQVGTKYGVAVVAETNTLAMGDFGNHDALRSGLISANLAVLRDTQRSASAMWPTRINPTPIPQQWHNGMSTTGVGYTHSRNAAFRAFHVPQTR